MKKSNVKVWRNWIIRNWRDKEYASWVLGVTVTEWAVTFSFGWLDIIFALPRFFREE